MANHVLEHTDLNAAWRMSDDMVSGGSLVGRNKWMKPETQPRMTDPAIPGKEEPAISGLKAGGLRDELSQHGEWLVPLPQYESWHNRMTLDARRLVKQQTTLRDRWLSETMRHAIAVLRATIEVKPSRRGGVPVIQGTRMPLSRILAELAEDARLSDIAADYDLDAELLKSVLEGMSAYFDRPFVQ